MDLSRIHTYAGTCTYSGYTLFAAENVMDPGSDFFAGEGYFDAGYKVLSYTCYLDNIYLLCVSVICIFYMYM
jgi:hypothetical protein